jgi:hypothetical protein
MKKATAMPEWFLGRRMGAFERAGNYNASYIRAAIDVDARAMLAFGKFQGLSRYCQDVSLAIGFIAVMAEDGGPCIQFGADRAARPGVDSANLLAIAAGDG